ncbi:hypothetical protein, partial [Ornithinibacillus xuwenensis]
AAQTFNLPMDIENKPTKNGSNHHFLMFGTTFHLFLASYVPASCLTLMLANKQAPSFIPSMF